MPPFQCGCGARYLGVTPFSDHAHPAMPHPMKGSVTVWGHSSQSFYRDAVPVPIANAKKVPPTVDGERVYGDGEIMTKISIVGIIKSNSFGIDLQNTLVMFGKRRKLWLKQVPPETIGLHQSVVLFKELSLLQPAQCNLPRKHTSLFFAVLWIKV